MSEPTDSTSWVKPERYLQLDADRGGSKPPRSPGRIERTGKRPGSSRSDPRPDLFDSLEQAARNVPFWRRAATAAEALLVSLATRLRR